MAKKYLGRVNEQHYLILIGNPIQNRGPITVNIFYSKQIPSIERKDEIVEEMIKYRHLLGKVKVCHKLKTDYVISIIIPRDTKVLEDHIIKKGFNERGVLDTEEENITNIIQNANDALEKQNRNIFHDVRIRELKEWHNTLIKMYQSSKNQL